MVVEKVFTLEDLKTANMIVRNEYDSIVKDLQKQINDLKTEVYNLSLKVKEPSYAIRSLSTTVEKVEDKPQFNKFTMEQLQSLEVAYKSEKISDWERNFIDTLMTYQRVSEKQKPILKKIILKVAS